MTMLLHACCGPCAMYPVDYLLGMNKDIDLFWFNPNIHPEFEWNRRLQNLQKAADHFDVELITKEGFEEEYWRSKEYLKDYQSRCLMCYDVRLKETAEYAANNGYDSFCTTLLVSPYQQHDVIRSVGEKYAQEYNVAFEYYDFRPGFRQGQNMAREIELYRQKHCGCCFSLDESDFREKILKSFPQEN